MSVKAQKVWLLLWLLLVLCFVQILLKMLYIRPDAGLQAQECNLRVSIQPLRLNVDQVIHLRRIWTWTRERGSSLL